MFRYHDLNIQLYIIVRVTIIFMVRYEFVSMHKCCKKILFDYSFQTLLQFMSFKILVIQYFKYFNLETKFE